MARQRGFIRAVLGGMTAFALAFGGASAAVADETASGSISGIVTASSDASPLAGIDVHAESQDGLGSADAVTDADGTYALESLIDGDYVVRFSDPNGSYAAQYWNDVTDEWRAERISVVDGSATAAIDAALTMVPMGSISGTVTREDDGSALAGVTVTTSGPNGEWASAQTDDDGSYTVAGLVAGSHVVSFIPDGTDLKREYWQDAFDYAQATPVDIGDDEAVSGIDASLAIGGGISGTVTQESDGSPLAYGTVQALDDNNEIVGATTTDDDGAYALGGLPAGSYRLWFGSPDPDLASEYWENSYSWDGATLITITEGQTITSVDASLDPMGYISGTVTRASNGEPLFAYVSAFSASGGADEVFNSTESDGTYRIPVAPGAYRVQFGSFDQGIIEEYWEDTFLWEDATVLTVAPGEEVNGIDAALEEGGVISGTVTIDSDVVQDLTVEAWSGDKLVASTRADAATGAYSLAAPQGSYILKAAATFTDGTTAAAPQFYDGVATAEEATPVAVVLGETIDGVDFTLTVDAEPGAVPALSLSADSVRAGSTIGVSGSGFAPGAKIALELHSDPVTLGTLTADASGMLQGSFRIPAEVPAGTHTLVAMSGSTVLASASLTVTATANAGQGGDASSPEDALASTGGELPVALVVFGALMAVLGGMLVRRRVKR